MFRRSTIVWKRLQSAKYIGYKLLVPAVPVVVCEGVSTYLLTTTSKPNKRPTIPFVSNGDIRSNTGVPLSSTKPRICDNRTGLITNLALSVQYCCGNA